MLMKLENVIPRLPNQERPLGLREATSSSWPGYWSTAKETSCGMQELATPPAPCPT
jgi:hypothetical protein